MHVDEHINWQDNPNKKPKQRSNIFYRKTTFTASTRAFADEPQLAANFALDWLVSVPYCIFWHFAGSDKLSYFSYIGKFACF